MMKIYWMVSVVLLVVVGGCIETRDEKFLMVSSINGQEIGCEHNLYLGFKLHQQDTPEDVELIHSSKIPDVEAYGEVTESVLSYSISFAVTSTNTQVILNQLHKVEIEYKSVTCTTADFYILYSPESKKILVIMDDHTNQRNQTYTT